mmetsp:Transcript_111817/g.316598  ORF Transcript_111817/g.316598 Transcript_111817/m.316598 type:complete len:224 (-) Transcript_111817:92-763(-)
MSGPAELAWLIDDGARQNFSHASWDHPSFLFVAAAPARECLGSDDVGLRMMALTAWLDLLCKCKIRHVVCLADDDALRGCEGLGDGDIARTCQGQGLSFHRVPPRGPRLGAAVLAEAIRVLRSLRGEPTAVICADGQHASATAAASWLSLECGLTASEALKAVVDTAEKVDATRRPLVLEKGCEEVSAQEFEELLRETGQLVREEVSARGFKDMLRATRQLVS